MADTGASYGSLARYTDIDRIVSVNDNTLLSFSGELSDWQYLHGEIIKNLVDEDIISNDGIERSPREIHAYLTRVLHHYRNKANPLYNQLVVSGVQNKENSDEKELYLGYVDLYGTSFTDNYVATGFGLHMALPLLRQHYRDDLTYDEAKTILENAMRVLVYRHCRTINKFTIANITYDQTTQQVQQNISQPYELPTQWSYSRFVKPTHQELPLPNIR